MGQELYVLRRIMLLMPILVGATAACMGWGILGAEPVAILASYVAYLRIQKEPRP